MKWSYIIIPLITVAVASLGGMVTDSGLPWYETLQKPSWTPDGAFIGLMWTIIYTLTAIFALYVWNRVPRTGFGCQACMVIGLLMLNAVLNASWSYAFFGMQSIGLALFILVMLELTNIGIVLLAWPLARYWVILLAPYIVWVAIAGILNYRIFTLN